MSTPSRLPSASPRRVGAVLLLASIALAACGGGDSASFALCGNGRLDAGELCDDGNQIDEDACTAICRPARCGDGAIELSVEQCDGTNIPVDTTCASLGYGTGPAGRNIPACTADHCQFDVSVCGARFTPTPVLPTATPTVTRTPTPSPSPTPTFDEGACGNGLLEPGETCTTCPADCAPAACTPSGETATFSVALQSGRAPTRARVLLAYRSSALSLPGSGSDVSVRQRVRFVAPVPDPFMVNDLDYAVSVDSTRSAGLPAAPAAFVTARFDLCAGAPAPTVEDLACSLELCSDAAGAIADCRCEVRAQ